MIKDFSRTKIIATLGPASSDKDTLRKMFKAGLDVCRINFSHSNYEDAKSVINLIREMNVELDTDVAILADLQGPKLRVGEMEGGKVFLEKGSTLEFVTEKCLGNSSKIFMSYQEFPKDVNPGDNILLDEIGRAHV